MIRIVGTKRGVKSSKTYTPIILLLLRCVQCATRRSIANDRFHIYVVIRVVGTKRGVKSSKTSSRLLMKFCHISQQKNF